ncbi:radical SAM protein [Burkholderia gladioli pv. gladioli]|uniref:radical SAM protein n=1 Tax=Burkholderia gladioli TaxID=28095 RepID=UPI001FC85CE3|nr:radical SAM protein [Burkholderia gladioli]MDJ1160419.1 radical SAM protein [Burkholderia gladioli pv. gladioli]
MAYIVVCIATGWGSAHGGINVVNTGLARGTANILPKGGRCICVVEEALKTATPLKVEVISPRPFEADVVLEAVLKEVLKTPLPDIEGLLVIGHDLKTGQLAVDCAKDLQIRLGRDMSVKSAVISHMDYSEYSRRKGQSLPSVFEKSRRQHAVVSAADFAFAIGPLLADGFQKARRDRKDRVIALTPGSSIIRAQAEGDGALRFYMSGRLGLEDDPIKNGVLAVRAVKAAYIAERSSATPGRWALRGHFYACGVDPEKDGELIDMLKSDVREDAAFELESMPFTDRQEDLHDYLINADVALMPSWHEGFGLAGWEALCAGVPLVCSTQSGLAVLVGQLRDRFPDSDFAGVLPVVMAGGSPAGHPSEQDTDALRDAVQKMVREYPARKKAAMELAPLIRQLFTWEGCAAELLANAKWPWANPRDWFQRQLAAQRAVDSRDGAAGAEMILTALEACQSGHVERNWGQVCSAMNFFSDVGATATMKDRREFKTALEAIGKAIDDALAGHVKAGGLPILDTVFLDLCWRFLAAATKLAKNFGDFKALLPDGMRDRIFEDGFLRKELLFYVSRYSVDFDGRFDDQARDFLEPLVEHLPHDRALRIRAARLCVANPNLKRVIDTEGLPDFAEESERCAGAMARPFDIGELLQREADIAPTALALFSLKPDAARQSMEQPIGFFNRLDPKNEVTKTWRGDKRLAAGMITVSISSAHVFHVLEAMANDEEEAIRWAALDLAFSPVLRVRLASSDASSGSGRTLCAKLGKIVDIAVSFNGGHPWLTREFLHHYREEHSSKDLWPAQLVKFTLTDFPKSRELFGPSVGHEGGPLGRQMHPEVIDARERATEFVKRVLLVLPPISAQTDSGRAASKTSTPPLGLGLLATHISNLGHDVHLVDCHRFPHLAADVFNRAKTFNLIGFNTVFSTVRSTRQMLSRIRTATGRPVLVVGGPAVNLDGWQFSAIDEGDRDNWDFAISDDAVGNLELLVEALKTPTPWPLSNGLVANPHSSFVALRDVEALPAAAIASVDKPVRDLGWMKIQVDRRLYVGPEGQQYEPGRTRDVKGRVHEAHVVMSKGCDWNCSFCTERRSLSKGERRREVDSILEEIRQLAASHPNLRIQFIDDNLLPQIASPENAGSVRVKEGVAWAERFLNGLATIRRELSGSLTWRGIFRLEDFDAYEAQGESGGFVNLLSAAGCNMLAFGVESGNAARRHSIKAGGRKFTNQVVRNLFRRLRDEGIFTKAYFIIGGHKENVRLARETISFAVSSGATLAYFALYKDFVRAQKQLSRDRGLRDPVTESLLDYEQMLSGWDDAFTTRKHIVAASVAASLSEPVNEVERRTYQQLARLGFRFEDLVKYNDYHAKEGPAGKVLNEVTWNKPDQYFAMVEKAYRSFYLRRDFVSDFKQLVAAGY